MSKLVFNEQELNLLHVWFIPENSPGAFPLRVVEPKSVDLSTGTLERYLNSVPSTLIEKSEVTTADYNQTPTAKEIELPTIKVKGHIALTDPENGSILFCTKNFPR